MALTRQIFREIYREFSDVGVYEDSEIDNLIKLAVGDPANNIAPQLNPDRWMSRLDFATGLYVAHYLVIMERNRRTARAGGIPGEMKGPRSSSAVDRVSASYDTQAISLKDMGFWGQTTYGLQLFQMARQAGTFAFQV